MAKSNHALSSSLLRQAEERAKSEMSVWEPSHLQDIVGDMRRLFECELKAEPWPRDSEEIVMSNVALDLLKGRHPWPSDKPNVSPDDRGWFCGQNMKVLGDLVQDTSIVLELGAFLGMSTAFLAQRAMSVITIDHWKGSIEHQGPEWKGILPVMYETFLVNLWEHREKVIPIRATTLDGMREVHELGVVPDIVYIDASHDASSVEADFSAVLDYWPSAKIIGDDWTWDSVRDGVERVLPKVPQKRRFTTHTTCWLLT